VLALAAAPALGGCGAQDKPPANVVLIVLDTVRADHLSCYGYPRPTTPHLDSFAAGADRHLVARATAPWTLPSHASLFTGKLPQQHGADAFKLPSGAVADAAPLSADELTLAEALAEAGYSTGAFAANKGYVNPRMGLAQGFTDFMSERYDALEMSRRAAQWVAAQPAQRPWFLFVNYMDAHRPYNTNALPGARAAQLPTPAGPDEPGAVASLDALYNHVFLRKDPPPPELVQRVVDNYDLALANLDLGLGALFADLRVRGLLDGALVVITSDHGEYFGEHDLVEHSKDIYEQALRIPLIVKRPGQAAGRVLEAPISLADVPRLMLREAAPEVLEKHADKFKGSADAPGHLAQARYARSKDLGAPWRKRFDRERDALYVENYKLIRSSDGRHELYDLAKDPAEGRNLFAERPAEAQTLLAQIERVLTKSGPRATAPLPALTAQERRAMAELGYADYEEAPPEAPKHDGVEPDDVPSDADGERPSAPREDTRR
jgi:arylsulfatase A-like enzyme